MIWKEKLVGSICMASVLKASSRGRRQVRVIRCPTSERTNCSSIYPITKV